MKASLQTQSLLPERLARHTLTASERNLADALRRNYPHALLESATALAARTGTSASTVVRMFAKLGYASYAEAQREARGEVTALLQTAGQRAAVTIAADRSLQQCVDDALLHDQHNIAATRESLDMRAFEGMARRLAEGKGRVYVMALINSAPVGAWLALHLNMCRPGVQELGAGAVTPVDQMLWIQPEDTLLAFTIRRYANGPVKVAQRFRELGAKVLAIVDSPNAPLTRHANQVLQVRISNASPFDSYTAAFFLANALVSAVAQLRSDAVSATLSRRDSLWTDFENELIPADAKPRKARAGDAAAD